MELNGLTPQEEVYAYLLIGKSLYEYKLKSVEYMNNENSVKKSFVSGIPMEHTAIPILALLIALITLPIIRRRK